MPTPHTHTHTQLVPAKAALYFNYILRDLGRNFANGFCFDFRAYSASRTGITEPKKKLQRGFYSPELNPTVITPYFLDDKVLANMKVREGRGMVAYTCAKNTRTCAHPGMNTKLVRGVSRGRCMDAPFWMQRFKYSCTRGYY